MRVEHNWLPASAARVLSRFPAPASEEAFVHDILSAIYSIALHQCGFYLRRSLEQEPMTRHRLIRSSNIAAIAACVYLASGALSTAAMAADADKGDASVGHALVYTCGGCHGVTGYKNAYPNYHVPRIAGQNYDYLVAALTEYKKGERAHPTMRAQGESLSDEDIRNIAAYLSSLSP